MGRPGRYEKELKPHIEDIKKAVAAGATLQEIAEAYHFAVGTICDYKNKYPEFAEAFTRGREQVIIEIKAALLKKALGYEYEEKKQYVTEDANGNKKMHTEIWKRHMPPSETAAAMLMRNYDKTWLDRDITSTELKKQELDLRKAIAESNNFDLKLGD